MREGTDRSESRRARARRAAGLLLSNKKAAAGAALLVLLLAMAVLAPWISPHDPLEQNLCDRLRGPSWQYPLGADHLGRCILSRLVFGSRISLLVAAVVVLATMAAGTLLGIVSGYFGGWLDKAVMAVVDVFLAFPGLILMMVVAGLLGQSLLHLVLVLSLEGWKGYCRVVRSVVLAEKEKDFVVAAHALGAGSGRILLRHILPGCTPTVFVLGMLNMGHIILAAAGLGFLGLGPPPPTPEWGAMINDGRFFLRTAPGLTLWPGVAILVTILAFNLLGEGLQEQLSPRRHRGA